MPFESSTPLVVACALCGVVAIYWWMRTQMLWLAGLAGLVLVTALGLFVADRLVITDREYLEALFPRLAVAAEQRDISAILAHVDPDLTPLRREAEQILEQVKPTQILITFLEVTVDDAQNPPRATADVVVRVAGNVIDAAGPGNILAEFRVFLNKKDGLWLIRDVETDRARLGRSR